MDLIIGECAWHTVSMHRPHSITAVLYQLSSLSMGLQGLSVKDRKSDTVFVDRAFSYFTPNVEFNIKKNIESGRKIFLGPVSRELFIQRVGCLNTKTMTCCSIFMHQ